MSAGDDYGSFADHPETIGERRADRAENAALWSPRDVLVSVLREIDRGEIAPDALVVVHRQKMAPGDTRTRHSVSSPDMHVTLGLLARAMFTIQENTP